MIVTEGLTKHYDQLAAVQDLNLKIEEGDVFGFIGPNGAGKTTTMKMLATLMRPTSGSATIAGYSIINQLGEVRQVIGYMPDFFGAYEGMKVHEYLEFFAAAYKIKGEKRSSVVNDVLELTDLVNKRDTLVQHLSRGMQQRLGLARVLTHDPKVLLLDEPASGLDPRARIEMRELLKELQKMGKTILISSHILHELGEICNKIGIIEQGRLLFSGKIEEIVAKLKGGKVVEIRVKENMDKAVSLLKKYTQVSDIKENDGKLVVKLSDPDIDISVVPKILIKGGIDLTYFSEESFNLEDVFMKITQGIVS